VITLVVRLYGWWVRTPPILQKKDFVGHRYEMQE